MKGLLLFSAGIDSPVAAHLMQEQGVEVTGLHFNNTDNSIERVEDLAQKLGIKLIIIPNKHNQLYIQNKVDPRYHCVICKRFMYRVAEQLALTKGYDTLITGENLGQVASQTLKNLVVLDKAVKITVLRPLLCYDKEEIVQLAKKIGTYKISIKQKKKCPFLPKHPTTQANLQKVVEEEKLLHI